MNNVISIEEFGLSSFVWRSKNCLDVNVLIDLLSNNDLFKSIVIRSKGNTNKCK